MYKTITEPGPVLLVWCVSVHPLSPSLLRVRGPRAQTIDLSIMAEVAATSRPRLKAKGCTLKGEDALHCCMPLRECLGTANNCACIQRSAKVFFLGCVTRPLHPEKSHATYEKDFS